MVDTRYLLKSCMANPINDEKTTILRTPKPLHQRFRAAAKVEGMDVSNMIRQFMTQTVLRVKNQDLEAFEIALKAIQEADDRKESAEKTQAVPVVNLNDEKDLKKKRA
jgi:hypothetical protein